MQDFLSIFMLSSVATISLGTATDASVETIHIVKTTNGFDLTFHNVKKSFSTVGEMLEAAKLHMNKRLSQYSFDYTGQSGASQSFLSDLNNIGTDMQTNAKIVGDTMDTTSTSSTSSSSSGSSGISTSSSSSSYSTSSTSSSSSSSSSSSTSDLSSGDSSSNDGKGRGGKHLGHIKAKCFPADSTVETNKGRMTMADIYHSITEGLQVMTAGGQFSSVKLWIHAEPLQTAEFLRLITANGQSISLTRGHLVFKTDCDRLQRQSVQAGKISPGDCLMVDIDGHLQAQQVVKVDKFSSVGFYSPLTASGNLLVDNILASCYSEVEAVQLQSIMFDYINMIKSGAKQLLSANLFSAVFGHTDNVSPLPEVIDQFLGLSKKFIA